MRGTTKSPPHLRKQAGGMTAELTRGNREATPLGGVPLPGSKGSAAEQGVDPLSITTDDAAVVIPESLRIFIAQAAVASVERACNGFESVVQAYETAEDRRTYQEHVDHICRRIAIVDRIESSGQVPADELADLADWAAGKAEYEVRETDDMDEVIRRATAARDLRKLAGKLAELYNSHPQED